MTSEFDELVSQIYLAGAGLRAWSLPLRTLAELTGSRHALLQASSLRTSPVPLAFLQDDGELDHSLITHYGDYMEQVGDPRVEYAAALYAAGQPRAFNDFDFLEERDMTHHSYYGEILAPLGLKYASVQLLPRRGDLGMGVTLQRTPAQGPVQAAEVELQRRATVHIDQALRMLDALYPGSAPGDPAIAGLGTASVSVLGLGGQVLLLDASLERLALSTGICRLKNNYLMGASMSLQRAMDRALFGASRGRVEVLPLEGTAIDLKFLPLVPDEGLFLPAPRVLVTAQPRHVEPQGRYATLRERYGLTPSEVEVARLLAEGVAPKEIASRRDVSVHTVRTQMKSVFQKLDVRSQRELVVALASLSDGASGGASRPG